MQAAAPQRGAHGSLRSKLLFKTMTRFSLWVYRYFRKHRAVFWTVLVALFAFFGYYASKLHLEEDLNRLLPSSRNADGSLKLAFADLRIKDKTFLLFHSLKGADTERLSEVCDAFTDSLLHEDSLRGKGNSVVGDIFSSLPESLMDDGISYMEQHFPAYIPPQSYVSFDSLLTPARMRKQMVSNRKDLEGTVGDLYPELIEMDPIGMRSVLEGAMKPLFGGGGGSYKIVGNHIFVNDRTVCLAFITPRYSATDTGQGSAMFTILNRLIDQFAKTCPDVKISYHGTPAHGFYNATTIKRDLKGTVIGSLVVALLLLWLCFRSNDTLPLLLTPVAFGTLAGLAMMYFIKGEFSLLALGIGAVVLGVALSYVLHLITHFKYVGDIEQTLREQVRPIMLGCITTIGSFIGLVFVKTDLLRDFGLFASFAILGTTLFTLLLLPQFFSESTKKKNERAFALISRINALRFDRSKPFVVSLVAIILLCLVTFLVKGTDFDSNMHDLGYVDPGVAASEQLLSKKTFTGDKSKYFASTGKSAEEAVSHFSQLSRQLDSLKSEGLVKSYTPTQLLFVPLKEQQQRIDHWHRYWTAGRLSQVRTLIASTAPGADLEASAFEPFFDAARASYKPDALYKAGIIPEGYLSTLMEKDRSGHYLCYTSVRCADNDSVYNRICKAVASRPNQLVLDTYYYTTDNLVQLNHDFNVLQWLSMVFVLIVLMLSFRFRWKPTLLSFLPIILSWIVVLGAMDLFGMRFNLVNVIISTFIFGIGVDYSIFVMTGLMAGGEESTMLAYHKTAIFFSALILIITVGSMLLAVHPAIKSVGFATLVGLLAAVLLSYTLQPALYRLLNKKLTK